MSKPRSDAKLLNLPDAKQLAIYKIVRSGVSFIDAVVLIRKEHGLSVSVGALHNFYKKASERFQRERIIRAVADADAIKKAAKEIGSLDKAIIAEMSQKAFELMVTDHPDTGAVSALIGCILDLKKQDMSERAFKLDLEKFREAMKSSVEKGLDALFDEIKGSRSAETLFKKLKATVLKQVDAAA